MTRQRLLMLLASCLLLVETCGLCLASEPGGFTRQEDVIYGRKDGMALTMDVFNPKDKMNGAAVILVVSGGFFSSHEAINPAFVTELLNRGYTIFAVVHGSQPRYTIPDAIADINRSVRYIRYHAKDFKIDPQRIGITGGSAGGHLSLMIGTAGRAGDPNAADPVERISSRVQAVACFFPVTDFLNYGKEGFVALGTGPLAFIKAPFDFRELDPKTKAYVPITDSARRLDIGREISPVTHVTKDSAPTLIIHGDADTLVPIQQSQRILVRFREVGVPAELVVKHGYGHGWLTILLDMPTIANWFDKYLTAKDSSARPPVKLGDEVLFEQAPRPDSRQARRPDHQSHRRGFANLDSIIEKFRAQPDVKLVALYGPEHGVRGNAQAGRVCRRSIIDEHYQFAGVQSLRPDAKAAGGHADEH